MSLCVEKTKLEGVLLITPYTFEDFRGEYMELYNHEAYRQAGIDVDFVQDDISMSSRGVLRGFHGDLKTTKMVTCLLGRFYMVVANCNEDSPAFGQWQAFTLTERNRFQVLVPPRYGLAHLALTDRIIFHYKQSTYYDPAAQFTRLWNDPRLNVWWPVKNPILSQRDEQGYR